MDFFNDFVFCTLLLVSLSISFNICGGNTSIWSFKHALDNLVNRIRIKKAKLLAV